jgi:hypothetical protein|tara:strand:- start:329 stop:493 length:165 start_codon:yes stop_codon:yes gene_type:complete
MITNWELSIGFYPGVLIGFRSYPDMGSGLENHVLYLPFIDLCLTLEREANDEHE